MSSSRRIADPDLERQGRRMARPAVVVLALAATVAVVGAVLAIVGSGGVWVAGITLVVLAGAPAVVGAGLLAASAVSRWAARRRPFA